MEARRSSSPDPSTTGAPRSHSSRGSQSLKSLTLCSCLLQCCSTALFLCSLGFSETKLAPSLSGAAGTVESCETGTGQDGPLCLPSWMSRSSQCWQQSLAQVCSSPLEAVSSSLGCSITPCPVVLLPVGVSCLSLTYLPPLMMSSLFCNTSVTYMEAHGGV